MPLHCAAIRPKFLNVFSSISALVACLEDILEHRTLKLLIFFVFSRLLFSTLVLTSSCFLLYNIDSFHQTWQVFLKGVADPTILVPANKVTRQQYCCWNQPFHVLSGTEFIQKVPGE